ncbi:STAS domain-containing protein [Cellulomonas aerilata]|uniref:Anti-sigma factor antagonist n=1 Tax=Cellulomonas aerilata TaxID=515326 RepID=A0A512D7T9_9CELL|nr:STAS domain-containing protein [Cellulomonas aerilata]GEO32572.1 anti-sigma-B factor antagonist [Cellulomonas aerilata]
MDVSVEHDDLGPVVMRVTGEVDVATAAPLRQELAVHMGSHQQDLIVDVSGVTFMDSTGLGVLVRAVRQVHERGGRIELVSHEDPVMNLLRLTALADVLPVHKTVHEARAALSGG